MQEFNAEQHRIETASALEVIRNAESVEIHAAYVGLDVHKDTIAVAVAEPAGQTPQPGARLRWRHQDALRADQKRKCLLISGRW